MRTTLLVFGNLLNFERREGAYNIRSNFYFILDHLQVSSRQLGFEKEKRELGRETEKTHIWIDEGLGRWFGSLS